MHCPPAPAQDGWLLNRKKIINYLLRVESEYKPNSYHNNTHAADVTQTAVVILESFKRQVKDISKLEYFSVIIAAAVHDLGHLGVNNDFLINSRHPRATTYNDKSVNENFHIGRAFAIARESPDLDIFDKFSIDEQKQVRMKRDLAPRTGFFACVGPHVGTWPFWARPRRPLLLAAA